MFDIKRLGLYALAVFFCLKLSDLRDGLADRLLTCSAAEWVRVQPGPGRLFFCIRLAQTVSNGMLPLTPSLSTQILRRHKLC